MGKHHATNLAVLSLLTLLTADVTSSFDINSFNNQKPCKANPCTSKQVPVPIKYVFLIVSLHVTKSLVQRLCVYLQRLRDGRCTSERLRIRIELL